MTSHDDISDADIDGWLHTLGITSLCQWDVLVFLYRHQTSLVGADVIAHLLGYASDLVVAALDVLEFLGLVAPFPGVPKRAHLSVHRAAGPSAEGCLDPPPGLGQPPCRPAAPRHALAGQ